jgi:hypothetical protein
MSKISQGLAPGPLLKTKRRDGKEGGEGKGKGKGKRGEWRT